MRTRQIARRTFLRGVVPLPLILTAAARPSVPRRVKFGLVSDVHRDVMPDGVDRIRRFVTAMQEAGADFILQLGDFCWPHPRTILAVFSGHFHQDYVLENNGVRYVQINSASYVWLPEAAARETYPPEMHRAHPHLRNVAAYQDPLWALVTVDLDRGELVVEGTRSRWLGPDPWERGASETDYPRDKCRPAISDRRFTLHQRQ